jgi:hypothetical protein
MRIQKTVGRLLGGVLLALPLCLRAQTTSSTPAFLEQRHSHLLDEPIHPGQGGRQAAPDRLPPKSQRHVAASEQQETDDFQNHCQTSEREVIQFISFPEDNPACSAAPGSLYGR